MMRSKFLLAGLLFALLSTSGLTRQRTPQNATETLVASPPKGGPAEGYLEIITMYRRGYLSTASRELRSSSPKDVTAAIDELKQFPPSNEDLWAATLLHTELAVSAAARGELNERHFHMETASELIEMTRGTGGRVGFHRRWLIAMGYYYLSQLEEDLAVMSFEQGLELSPDDGEILVAMGSVRETISLVQAGGTSDTLSPSDGALPPTNSSEYRSMLARLRGFSVSHSQLAEAESFYRRALELDAANAEAHLRLGRVLQQTGLEDEAMEELSWVIDNSKDRFLRGAANLFIGRLLEGRKRRDAAVAHYREAVRLQPNWQVAQLALGHALHRSGERKPSKQIIEEAFSPKDRSSQGGLWQYYFCRDRFIDAIRKMRREISL